MNLARLAGRIDTMEEHLHSVEHRLDASFVAFSTQILQSDHETRDAILAIVRRESAHLEGALRGEMAEMETRLRAEIAAMGDGLRGEMADMATALRGEMAEMATTLRGEMATMEERLREEMHALHGIAMRRIDRLEKSVVDGMEETRRFMQVLHEDTLSRIALLAEGRAPLN